jgi:hypothetical protein
MLQSDIDAVDYWIHAQWRGAGCRAWDRIKKELVETQNTPTNKQSTPCPLCGKPWDMSKCNTCSCGAFFKRL